MSLQGQMTLPPLSLMPYSRMRKKRPSYSPVKNAVESPDTRGYGSNPSTSQKLVESSSTDNDALNTGLASLQFEEFSWNDGKGGYKGVTAAHFGMLHKYLKTLYPEVETIEERTPFLVIWCRDSVPESSKRPFLIAGLMGVWLVAGLDNLPFELEAPSVGNMNNLLELDDDDLVEDIRKYHIPKTETLCRLMREHFSNALALSFIHSVIVVELPELPTSKHSSRLQEYPSGFRHDGPSLFYHNGLRVTGKQNQRLKQPKAEAADGQYDDSDYVAAQGHFQPGSMLCADSGNMVSAGILVEKGDEQRLTVAIHCWQKELHKIPEKIGDGRSFCVRQGRTHVGHVSSRLGDTDIGLATLNDGIDFRNEFLDIPGRPKELLSSDMLKVNDYYMVDSFTTGRQGAMLCQGKRIITQEEKTNRRDNLLRGVQKDLPNAGMYQVLVQGIFATSEPRANGEPIIREGCCGSALVQLVKAPSSRGGRSTPSKKGVSRKQSTPSTEKTPVKGGSATPKENSPASPASTKLVPKDGELGFVPSGKIGGFMHCSDLQYKSNIPKNTPMLYCYAEVTDPLIDAGWRVASSTGKRKRTGSEDPFLD